MPSAPLTSGLVNIPGATQIAPAKCRDWGQLLPFLPGTNYGPWAIWNINLPESFGQSAFAQFQQMLQDQFAAFQAQGSYDSLYFTFQNVTFRCRRDATTFGVLEACLEGLVSVSEYQAPLTDASGAVVTDSAGNAIENTFAASLGPGFVGWVASPASYNLKFGPHIYTMGDPNFLVPDATDWKRAWPNGAVTVNGGLSEAWLETQGAYFRESKLPSTGGLWFSGFPIYFAYSNWLYRWLPDASMQGGVIDVCMDRATLQPPGTPSAPGPQPPVPQGGHGGYNPGSIPTGGPSPFPMQGGHGIFNPDQPPAITVTQAGAQAASPGPSPGPSTGAVVVGAVGITAAGILAWLLWP